MLSEIEIVEANLSHHPFIFATWLRCYGASRYARLMDSRTYFNSHKKLIEGVLNAHSAICLVATAKENGIILGYLIAQTGSEPVVHFCFVKGAFRRMGVAKALTNHLKWNLNRIFFTHYVDGMSWILRKYPGLKFNPYLLGEVHASK